MSSKWNYVIPCWQLTYFQCSHAISLLCLSSLEGDRTTVKRAILDMEMEPEVISSPVFQGQ